MKGFAGGISKRIREALVPKHLRNNHIKLSDSELKKIEHSIRTNYHKGWRNEESYSQKEYAKDLSDHLYERLETDRLLYTPWLYDSLPLKDANVLEIGCGTGSSTVTLAEQGANVTGVDIDEDALIVAKDRCGVYDVPAKFIAGNATEVYQDLKNEKFDLIIFYACIEHMIYKERIESLKLYYDLLPKGGMLSIAETPNRLWYFDNHTSNLPFFHWLPDRIAYDYSKFSSRDNFKELYEDYTDENFLHFLRRGRGFSFHELEIALDIPAEEISVDSYLKRPSHLNIFSLGFKYHRLLKKIYPSVNKGFFYPWIDIIIKKT